MQQELTHALQLQQQALLKLGGIERANTSASEEMYPATNMPFPAVHE